MILPVRPSVCPSIAYITNNSRTQRSSVPKFGKKRLPTIDENHVPDSRSKGQRSLSPGPLMLTYIVRHSFRILSYLLTYLCVASRGKNLRQFVAVFQWVMATSYGDRATSWSSVVQRRLSLVSRTPTLCAGSPRCTKCNRPPINSTSSVGYQLRIIRCSTIMPLESKGLING